MSLCIASISILTACGGSSSNDDTLSATDHRTTLSTLSGRSFDISLTDSDSSDDDGSLATSRIRISNNAPDQWYLFPENSKTTYNGIEFIRSSQVFHGDTINNVELSSQVSLHPQNTRKLSYMLYEYALLGQRDLYARTFEEEYDIHGDGSEITSIKKTDLVDGSYYEHQTYSSKQLSETPNTKQITTTRRSNGMVQRSTGTEENTVLESNAYDYPTKERFITKQTGSIEYFDGNDENNPSAKITYTDIYISTDEHTTWMEESIEIENIYTSFNVPLEIEVFKNGETYTYNGQFFSADESGEPTNSSSNLSNFISELYHTDSESENPVARLLLSLDGSKISIYMYDGDTLEATPLHQN